LEGVNGGPRRIAPATHMEWYVRREELKKVVSWGLADCVLRHVRGAASRRHSGAKLRSASQQSPVLSPNASPSRERTL